jgi:hypothetical protein
MLDVGLTASSEGLKNLVIDFSAANTYFNEAASALEFRVDTLVTTMGSRSNVMSEDYTKLDKIDGRFRKEKLTMLIKSVMKPVLTDQDRSFGMQINSLRQTWCS